MRPLSHIADLVFDTPLMILPSKLKAILSAVGPRLVADPESIHTLIRSGVIPADAVPAYNSNRAAWDDDDSGSSSSSSKSEKPYQLTDAGVAIIPVKGVLMKEGGWMSALSGCSSYSSITKSITTAMSDPQVRAVLFNVNSPGGTTHGCFELSDLIHSYRGNKPMLAVANDLAASAAYAIASAADSVYLTRTAGVGSIGVFCLHCSEKGADKQAGLDYTYIFYGEHKVSGNPHESLSDAAAASMQTEVDREGDIFVSTVARNRGKSAEVIKGTKADVLFADSAIPLLADRVGTFDDALAELTGKVLGTSATISVSSGRRSEGVKPNMANATKPDLETLRKNAADAAQVLKEAEASLASAAPAATSAATSGGTTNIHIANATFGAAAGKRAKGGEGDLGPKGKKKEPEPKDEDEDEEEREEEDEHEGRHHEAGVATSACDNPDHEEGCTGSGEGHEAEYEGKGKKGKKMKSAAASNFTVEMASEISDLCALVGQDKLAAKFIRERTTVAKVREHLINLRATESADTAVNSSFGAVSTNALATIEQQATALVTTSGGKIDRSVALMRVMQSNPDLYEKYNEEREAALRSPGGMRTYVQLASAHMASFGLAAKTLAL